MAVGGYAVQVSVIRRGYVKKTDPVVVSLKMGKIDCEHRETADLKQDQQLRWSTCQPRLKVKATGAAAQPCPVASGA